VTNKTTNKGLDMVRQLKKQFLKDFGPACKDYYWTCHVCEGWRMLDALEDLYDFNGIMTHKLKGLK